MQIFWSIFWPCIKNEFVFTICKQNNNLQNKSILTYKDIKNFYIQELAAKKIKPLPKPILNYEAPSIE